MEKYQRTFTLPPIEFIKFQLNQSINFPVPTLNETDITILAYVCLFKREAKNKIVIDRILTSRSSCYNYFVKLRHMGYLIKDEEGYKINPKIQLAESDYIQVSIVKIDPDSVKVYHPYFKK